ncbi:MAG: hypothetical protein KY466_16380 [Gemmatimonadetes bacterium]|nr:hypothetical protein [Gemmatimonadota bacterium]
MLRRMRICAPVLVALLGTACFDYRQASVSELAPGETVRAYVTREHARELEGLGGFRGRELVGKVVESDRERILLDVRAVSIEEAGAGRMFNQRIAVPVSEVMDLEQRALNGWKTALVTVGITAALGGLIAWQFNEGANSPERETPNPPEAVRMPGIRILVPSSP